MLNERNILSLCGRGGSTVKMIGSRRGRTIVTKGNHGCSQGLEGGRKGVCGKMGRWRWSGVKGIWLRLGYEIGNHGDCLS